MNRLLLIVLGFFTFISDARGQPTVLWDESIDGDLSNDMDSPTLLSVDRSGEYVLRATTGPMTLQRMDRPVEIAGQRLEALRRLDQNVDGRLDRSEAEGNYAENFETFDLNDDNEVTFQEIGQFRLGGDIHDLFDFVLAPGINLVSIKVNRFDGGGVGNDASVFVVMDRESGAPREARGVEMTSKSDVELANYQVASPQHIAGPVRAGAEVYAQFEVWRAYDRNDSSNFFRLGEMQAMSRTELLFVFE